MSPAAYEHLWVRKSTGQRANATVIDAASNVQKAFGGEGRSLNSAEGRGHQVVQRAEVIKWCRGQRSPSGVEGRGHQVV